MPPFWNLCAPFWNLAGTQLLDHQEWSRIEIGHVEEGGNFFLTLSVGGSSWGERPVSWGAILLMSRFSLAYRLCLGS